MAAMCLSPRLKDSAWPWRMEEQFTFILQKLLLQPPRSQCQRYSYLVSQVGAGVGLPGARPLLTEDTAGLGSPVFRQLPKNVDGSVDSRSRHVPRARTKENMECFLDDTVSIQSHAFLREGSEEGSWLSAGVGALLQHTFLSADMCPWAVPTAKGVCAGCSIR